MQIGPVVGARIGLGLIEGNPVSIREIRDYLSSYSTAEVVDWLTRAMALLWKADTLYHVETQKRILGGLCGDKLLNRVASQHKKWDSMQPCVFFDEGQILSVLRLALECCKMTWPRGNPKKPHMLARALLAINDHFRKPWRAQPSKQDLLHSLLPEFFFQYREHPRWSVARWECMLSRIPNSLGRAKADYVDNLFGQATGHSVVLYRAMSAALLAKFAQLIHTLKIEDEPLVIPQTAWLANYNLTGTEASAINTFVMRLEGMRSRFRGGPKATSGAYYFEPFRERPLVTSQGKTSASGR